MAGPSGATLALVRMLSASTALLRTSAAISLKALCSSSAEATKVGKRGELIHDTLPGLPCHVKGWPVMHAGMDT